MLLKLLSEDFKAKRIFFLWKSLPQHNDELGSETLGAICLRTKNCYLENRIPSTIQGFSVKQFVLPI